MDSNLSRRIANIIDGINIYDRIYFVERISKFKKWEDLPLADKAFIEKLEIRKEVKT